MPLPLLLLEDHHPSEFLSQSENWLFLLKERWNKSLSNYIYYKFSTKQNYMVSVGSSQWFNWFLVLFSPLSRRLLSKFVTACFSEPFYKSDSWTVEHPHLLITISMMTIMMMMMKQKLFNKETIITNRLQQLRDTFQNQKPHFLVLIFPSIMVKETSQWKHQCYIINPCMRG